MQMFDTSHDEKRDTAIPEFHVKHVRTGKTTEDGLPEYMAVEYVKIFVGGDPLNVPDLPVTDQHRERFAGAYQAFLKGQEPPENGMPLEQWPGVNHAEVSMLKSKHIKTVEQLANAQESTMPAKLHDLIHRARVFLETASGGKVAEDLRKQVTSLKRANTTLKNTVEEQKNIIKSYELKERRESA